MTELYLKFCGRDETRPYLTLPIDDGDKTYCTDARVIIRVPKFEHEPNDRIGVQNAVEKIRTFYKLDGHSDYKPLPVEPADAPWGKACEQCDGKGNTDHVTCGTCGAIGNLGVTIRCPECGGTGRDYYNARVTFGNQDLNPFYIKLISQLPNVVAANPKDPGHPLHFKFDGGDGLLMPMRPKSEKAP